MKLLTMLMLPIAALLGGCDQATATDVQVNRAPVERAETPVAMEPAPEEEQKKSDVRHPLRIFQLADLQVVEVKVGDKPIKAWVMDTNPKRQEGMMFLRDGDVADDQGMIFVFPESQPLSFWMQNTYIPLDIIYITAEGRVQNVQRGRPLDERGLPSDGEAKYVLELKAGMAERLNIRRGTTIRIPETVKAKN
jgi:uncharacterized protein